MTSQWHLYDVILAPFSHWDWASNWKASWKRQKASQRIERGRQCCNYKLACKNQNYGCRIMNKDTSRWNNNLGFRRTQTVVDLDRKFCEMKSLDVCHCQYGNISWLPWYCGITRNTDFSISGLVNVTPSSILNFCWACPINPVPGYRRICVVIRAEGNV